MKMRGFTLVEMLVSLLVFSLLATAGVAVMARSLDAARASGFRRCYLETLCGMDAAMRLYERTGFRRIDAPLGATGHGSCNTFYLLDL